jgi:formate dehydrogenase maturation protein FdhE
MSRGYRFSYDSRPHNPNCDICGIPPVRGAVLVHKDDRPGVAVFVSCSICAIEVAFVIIRNFWPQAGGDTEPPPPSDGGEG